MHRFLWLLLICGLASQAPAQDFSAVDRRIQTLVSSTPLPGAVLLLARADQPVFAKAYGGYNLDQRVALASASKWLSAAVLLRLVERGVLRWDQRVVDWIPEAPADKHGLTLRQLFSHTSGLPGDESGCIGQPQLSLQACVEQILRLPLAYVPGTGFDYGGLSMQVAGRMAERATGRSWDQLFRAEVAVPLGMSQTDYGFTATTPGLVEVSNPRIAGGIRSTAADYLRFLQALLRRGVVDGQQWLDGGSIDQLLRDQTRAAPVLSTPFPQALGYGFGNWLEARDATGQSLRSSSPGAFGTYPLIDREAGFVGVFLTQNLLRNVQSEVQAAYAEANQVLRGTPEQGQRVAGGYLTADVQPKLRAAAPGPTRLLLGWSGDSAQLSTPQRWTSAQQLARPAAVTAQFREVPALPATREGTVNGSRFRLLAPNASSAAGNQTQNSVRALLLSFHGSGGSADLPFSKPQALEFTRLLYAHGYAVASLDSSDRQSRQWQAAFSLQNPDVVNVQALLQFLRGEGVIGADTPVYCEGTSNGAAFCSRVSALLGLRGQSLMIAAGIAPVVNQAGVPTIWTLGRNDSTLAPGFLAQAEDSARQLDQQGLNWALEVIDSSVVWPERFARIDGISEAQSRQLFANLQAGGVLDGTGNLRSDPRGNALNNLLPAELRSRQGDIIGALENAAGEHEYYAESSELRLHFLESLRVPAMTGLWWRAEEPGWGLSLSQQGEDLLPIWYTYDHDGSPVWFSGALLELQPDGRWEGPTFRVRGTAFDRIAGPLPLQASAAGTLVLRPRPGGALLFESEIDGVRQQREIVRTRFSASRLPLCHRARAHRRFAGNRSDTWWNPDQSGWGLHLAEQDQTLVLTWYTYTRSGQPQWVIGTLARQADGSFSGPLNRPQRGTPFDEISNQPATSFPVPTVGSAVVRFLDGERAEFNWTLDGSVGSHDLNRFVAGTGELSHCH